MKWGHETHSVQHVFQSFSHRLFYNFLKMCSYELFFILSVENQTKIIHLLGKSGMFCPAVHVTLPNSQMISSVSAILENWEMVHRARAWLICYWKCLLLEKPSGNISSMSLILMFEIQLTAWGLAIESSDTILHISPLCLSKQISWAFKDLHKIRSKKIIFYFIYLNAVIWATYIYSQVGLYGFRIFL